MGPEQNVGSVQGSQIPSSGGQQNNTASVLEAFLSQNAGELTKLAEKAATPIAGGHATNIPLSMDPTPKQPGQVPLNHEEVVGAGNARAKGIGNAIVGTMNAISGIATAVDNKKRLEVASATQQLLTAQQAMDQAKIILQSDPNNQAAKDAIEHNTQIMNGILSNDKIRKAVAKGFNIDFTDPEANKTPDHAAVSQGIEMAKKTASYAEQFNQKTPTVMAPDTQAQAKYAAAIQEQKYRTEMMRAVIPLISAQIREGGALTREKMREASQVSLQQIKTQDAMERLNRELQGRQDLQNNAYLHRLSEITAEGNKQIGVFAAQMKIKDADPTELMKNFTAFDQKSTSTLSTLQKNIADNMQKRIQLAQTGADTGSLATIDNAIEQDKAAYKTYKNAVDSTKDYYSLQLTGKRYNDGSSSDNSDSSTTPNLGSAGTYDFPTSDSEEEDLYNPTAY